MLLSHYFDLYVINHQWFFKTIWEHLFDDDDIKSSPCIFICCSVQYQHSMMHVQYYWSITQQFMSLVGIEPLTRVFDHNSNHCDTFVILFIKAWEWEWRLFFSRVSHPWGVIPGVKTPGVTPGYFWPSLNNIFYTVSDIIPPLDWY